MQFCAVTAAIIVGAVAERGRLIPMMVFIWVWATLVYCPVACWAWNANGWFFKWGGLDYAGGGPVEIVSGMSALAYSMVLGRRQEKMMLNFRPHNVSLITLGTVFLWFGWLGFNGGSAFGANLRATVACWNSNLTAMFAAMTWVILDWRLARKWSMVGWCSGCISGLVAATPASGFIPPWASVVLGITTGIVANFATKSTFSSVSCQRTITNSLQSSSGSRSTMPSMCSLSTVSLVWSDSSSTPSSPPRTLSASTV
jgi:Amt family ammonium transporter